MDNDDAAATAAATNARCCQCQMLPMPDAATNAATSDVRHQR